MRSKTLAESTRKANGVYYTPDALVDRVVADTLGPLFAGKTPEEATKLRLLDPACGAGAFLLGAQRWLRHWYAAQGESGDCATQATTPTESSRIIGQQLYGVELDPTAVKQAQSALPDAAANIHAGNALTTFPWDTTFAEVFTAGGFDAVIGNPPWGQKAIVVSDEEKRALWERFPSSAGIFDLFRPFVELGVRLLRSGGRFGMVLPDVILLKNYPQTRLLLLDQLALDRLDWWGKAFAGAEIDVATIVGTKTPPAPGQRVAVTVHDPDAPLSHEIPQADFRANARHTFNLRLTDDRRAILEKLADCPRLGDYFEVHEGVHSGNIRADLFVAERLDDTCRPLYFGRDEIAPYRLTWHGKHIRLGAIPEHKTRERYANVGQAHWHEQPKVLVRRTGDFVLAAVDRAGRYASNNFFLVFPKVPCGLTLDGLCALLNSAFMTWYFRAVEPRQGRAFAELKIKHLSAFPLPREVVTTDRCQELNDLGARRSSDPTLDPAIHAEVRRLFDL